MKFLLASILTPLCVACSANSASGTQVPKYPHLVLERTGQVNNYGNPILKVLMFENGNLTGSVKAVSGRGWTQNKPRNVAGTQAPLPDGQYEVSPTVHYLNSNPELGSKFVDIFPLFPTGRTELGFHVDPSFNRDSVKDGTSGCIGIVDSQQRDTLFNFITRTNTQKLFVRIN